MSSKELIRIESRTGIVIHQLMSNIINMITLIQNHIKSGYPLGKHSVWLVSEWIESRQWCVFCPNFLQRWPPRLFPSLGNTRICRSWCDWNPLEKSQSYKRPSGWNRRLQSITLLKGIVVILWLSNIIFQIQRDNWLAIIV